MVLRLSALIMIMVFLGAPVLADVIDGEVIFATAGNNLGWTPNGCPSIASYGVVAGAWWAVTSGEDPFVVGPAPMSLLSSPKHYIEFSMRMRLTSGPKDRFGASSAQIYWETNNEPAFAEDKMVPFKTYGNGEWKTYKVRLGNHPKWNGTIRRLRIDPCSKSGARIEIAWIRIARDTTPPSFVAENMWTYEDGQSTNDSTPVISLRNYYDEVSGIDRVEFYWRPGASTSESDWQLDGVDADATDGFQHSYNSFANGVYDLGVKVYDKSGNVGYWIHGDDKWIDDLVIDSDLATRIDVNAAAVGDDVPKSIFGNNLMWNQWTNIYNPTTGRLPEALESRIADMGLPVFRYPGGCYSDTFYWKKSIGPVAQRPTQYSNGCNTNLYGSLPKFGLDEFLRFCEDRGYTPMITCRFRWPGGPRTGNATVGWLEGEDPYAEALQDAIDLVEYCNAPNDGSNPNGGTDWAAVRAANGHPEPYNVKLFEIGNEPWGPDPWGSPGNYGFDGPSEYSVAFLNYLEGMLAVDPTIKVSTTTHLQSQLDFDPISPEWSHIVYQITGSYINYSQAHPYLPYSAWQKDLLHLYDETMATPKGLDDLLDTQRTTIKLTTPEKEGQIKIRLTEWDINYGWAYDPAQGRVNQYHIRTLKVAVSLADALRVFIENRDLVESAEWWHLFGGIYSCIDSDASYTPNPAYHTFRIFNKHFGDKLVHSKITGSPNYDYIQPIGSVLKTQLGVDYLTAIASLSEDGKTLYVVVINKHRTDAISSQVNLLGFLKHPGKVDAEIWELNGLDVDDYNNPSNTKITESSVVFDPSFTYTFPAHSVTSFKFTAAPVEVDSVGMLKGLDDGTPVRVAGKPITAVFAPDTVYVEERDRSSGIRIETADASGNPGNLAEVTGLIGSNSQGERRILASSYKHDSSSVIVDPLGMALGSVAGPGVDPTGLLVTVWGRTFGAGEDYFYVDDGSNILGPTGAGGIKVYCAAPPVDGKIVSVTGICSVEIPAGASLPERVIRTRSASDVRVVF